MAEKNTPLINALLEQVGQDPNLETWRQKVRLPAKVVKSLCDSLKADPRFIGQPGRFYTSASALVEYIYKSWLAVQQRLQRRLEGQTRWLEMLKSDAELVQAANCSLDTLRTRAAEILAQLQTLSAPASYTPTKGKSKKTKNQKALHDRPSLSKLLFQSYREIEDVAERCAISYSIKNGYKVSDKEEDLEKFAKRRRKVEIRVSRLQEQLASRIPKGRDLTDARWLETLALATHNVPENEVEAKSCQASLLRKTSSVPFPVVYETNEDMTWFKNQKGRICFGLTVWVSIPLRCIAIFGNYTGLNAF